MEETEPESFIETISALLEAVGAIDPNLVVEDPSPEPRHRRNAIRQGENAVPRAKSFSVRDLKKLMRGRPWLPHDLEGRPKTRGECLEMPRPCPFVSCKHHLYLDVDVRTGTVKLNFPNLEPSELGHSCSLDIADAGGMTLEDVGEQLNITRERVRQVEVNALRKLRRGGDEDFEDAPQRYEAIY